MKRLFISTLVSAFLSAPALVLADPEPKKSEEKPSAEKPAEEKPDAEKPREKQRPPRHPEVGPPEEKPEKPAAEAKDAKSGDPEASSQERYGKYGQDLLNLFKPVVADARLSTVTVYSKAWSRQIAMGAVVSDRGYIVTKASELNKRPSNAKAPEGGDTGPTMVEVAFAKSEQFPSGLRMVAKVVDTYRPFDLALLKVDATGLRPVTWVVEAAPCPGTFLAAPSLNDVPVAYGVVSVEPRNLDDANKGFLGIGLEERDSSLFIKTIKEGSAAVDAGLKLDDILMEVNGKTIHNVEEFIRTISGHKALDKVKLKIKRGKEEKDVEAILRRRGDFPELIRRMEDPRNKISGALSDQRTGFPNALQHDLFLRPMDCGGPLVDLDGHVIGLNIARSGRIQSLAIPANVMADLVHDVGTTGKFNHPELDELKKNLDTLTVEQKMLKEREARMEKQIDEVKKKIEAIIGPEPKAVEAKPVEKPAEKPTEKPAEKKEPEKKP